MSEDNKSNPAWNQQNIIMMVLLGVVIVLLAANLFKAPPTVEVVNQTAEEEAPRKGANDRGRDEDPFVANQVKNTLLKGYVQIRDCYNAFIEKKPATTDGIVMIDWTIQPDGEVKKAELVSTELGDDDLSNCMIKAIEGFTFPPPPGGKPKYVAHKYRFKKDPETDKK